MKKIPAITAILFSAMLVSGCMTTVDMAVITRESGWKGRLEEDQAVELAQKHVGPA